MESISFFELQRKGHLLFWLGVKHLRDTGHPQFQELKKLWKNFLERAQTPIAVVENLTGRHYPSEEGAIHDGGEAGLVSFLAGAANVQLFCFEPDRHEEMNFLAARFGKEKVEYYYFGRAAAQWHRIVKQGNLEEYLMPFLKRDKDASRWGEFDFSIAHLREIHSKLFGGKMDLGDAGFFKIIESPSRQDNLLREIVTASGKFRDDVIVKSVKRLFETNDVFMVYGKYHREAHESGLRN